MVNIQVYNFMKKFVRNMKSMKKAITTRDWSLLHMNVGNLICYLHYGIQQHEFSPSQTNQSYKYLKVLQTGSDVNSLLKNDEALLALWSISQDDETNA